MFLIQNALKNIVRQRRRYRFLVPLLLICSFLTGIFMTVAVPCRMVRAGMEFIEYTDTEAQAAEERYDYARNLGQSAAVIQYGILLIGAVAVLYVSSLMIGERMFDVGILYAVGLSRGQIFAAMLIELFTVCTAALTAGLLLGRLPAEAWLKSEIEAAKLPEEILAYMGNGLAETLCLAASAGILLLPILRLTAKLLRTDPNGFLTDRR